MPTPTDIDNCKVAILKAWRNLTHLIEDSSTPDAIKRELKDIRNDDLEEALEALD